MGKYFICALMIVLPFVSHLRAGTTVDDGNPDTFSQVVSEVISNGGGTILVTMPISITDAAGTNIFDGQSKVVVSGGNTNAIFDVESGSLTLSNFTFANGASTNGGAVYVADSGMVTLAGCTFSNNMALGVAGSSAIVTTNSTNSSVFGAGGRGGVGNSAFGGAIFNLGASSVFNCQFLANSAIGGAGGDGADGGSGGLRGGNGGAGGKGGAALGGAIYNGGTLMLVNSALSGNHATGGAAGSGGAGGSGTISGLAGGGAAGGAAAGAGLYTANTNAMVVILNCTFSGNIAQGGNSTAGGTSSAGIGKSGPSGGGAFGAGVDNGSWMTLTNCTFFNNIAFGGGGGNGGVGGGRGGNGGNGGAALGGGLYNSGVVTVVNCTFSMGGAVGGTNGSAGSGISSGRNGSRGSSHGGNIANAARAKNSFTLANSIIATNLLGGGGFGRIVDGGYNISFDRSIPFKSAKKGGTSLMKVNPLIDGLANNGGPTETIPLPRNSPAVDFVPPDAPFTPPTFDQRDHFRPIQVFSNDWFDAGAFEVNTNEVTILKQPQSTNVLVGSNVTFSVTASGSAPLSFQWYFAPSNSDPNIIIDPGNALTNGTSATLMLTNVQLTNAGFYVVVVSNPFDSATSSVAQLTVTLATHTAPVITSTSPAHGIESVNQGDTASFSVTATGTAPLTFQWGFGGSTMTFTNIPGATNSSFSITNAQTTNAGLYSVLVTNNLGSTNATFSLSVSATNSMSTNPPPPAPLGSAAPARAPSDFEFRVSFGLGTSDFGFYDPLSSRSAVHVSRFTLYVSRLNSSSSFPSPNPAATDAARPWASLRAARPPDRTFPCCRRSFPKAV